MKEKRGVLDRRGAQAATRGPHGPEWPGTSTPQPKEGRGRLSKVQRTNKMWMHTDKQNRCSSINTHVIFSELHKTHLSSQRPKIIKQKQTLDYSFLMGWKHLRNMHRGSSHKGKWGEGAGGEVFECKQLSLHSFTCCQVLNF